MDMVGRERNLHTAARGWSVELDDSQNRGGARCVEPQVHDRVVPARLHELDDGLNAARANRDIVRPDAHHRPPGASMPKVCAGTRFMGGEPMKRATNVLAGRA